MKRKDLDDAYDEFSELPPSFPARKIRRLDAELPPIMEGGAGFHLGFEQGMLPENIGGYAPEMDRNLWLLQESGFPCAMEGDGVHMEQAGSLASEMGGVLESVPVIPPANDERALVLYKPADPQFLISPASSHISLNVSPSFLAGFSDQSMFWQRNSNLLSVAEEPTPTHEKSAAGSNPLALVPWVPREATAAARVESMEEGEEVETVGMEVEDGTEHAFGAGMAEKDEALQQRQQHCMAPLLAVSSQLLSPILWST